MQALCLSILLLAGPATLIGQTVWTRQKSDVLAWLHAIFFIDQSTGWAAGGNGTLLSTSDGGRTWRLTKPTDDSIIDIYFAGSKDGWLLCDRSEFNLDDGDERSYLLRTTDGGERWQRIDIAANESHSRLSRMLISADGKFWLIGEAGALFVSQDNGETWKSISLPVPRLLLSADFPTNGPARLAGAGTTILRSSDHGQTWLSDNAANSVAAHMRINSIHFPEPKFGWIVGDAGRIYATVDGGRTWQAQNSGVSDDLRDVRFLDVNEGWVVGADGVLLHTTDGGAHWEAENSRTRHPLDRLFVIKGDVWVVGFGGTILKRSVQ
jgi:photosystem II stability/assembly factor-like uncharacterized protein